MFKKIFTSLAVALTATAATAAETLGKQIELSCKWGKWGNRTEAKPKQLLKIWLQLSSFYKTTHI